MLVSACLVPTYIERRHFLNFARIRADRPGPDWGGFFLWGIAPVVHLVAARYLWVGTHGDGQLR